MKKLTIIKETIPLLEDLCSGYNTAIGDNARKEYLTALKCIMEVMHNLGILIEVYKTTEDDYLTRFRILADVNNKPYEQTVPCNIFSNDQYLCSLHEEKKPITQPTTVFRRGIYYV